jgi:uncharacterized membrane protein
MINIDKFNDSHGYRLLLSPNRSIGWRDLVLFYLFMCLLSLAVGVFFAVQGLWLILPFSGLEMFVLGIALYVVSRQTNRRQVIIFDNSKVRIEKGAYHCDQSWEFNADWVRLHYQITGEIYSARKLELECRGSYVEVGEFLNNIEKDTLAFQLKNCIIRG